MRNKFVSLSKQKHLQILSTISSPSIAWWPALLHPPVLSPSQSGSHWDVEDDLWLLIFSPLCWWALCGSVIWQQCVVITDEEESNCWEDEEEKHSWKASTWRKQPFTIGNISVGLALVFTVGSDLRKSNEESNPNRWCYRIQTLRRTRIGFFNHICVSVARPGRPQSPQRNSEP